MIRTISEINEKIKSGKAVVLTAEEMIELVDKEGVKKAAKSVDVVTTGTFGPMCSSGMYVNIGHSKPRIKLGAGECYLNDVPAYAGYAAVDIFLGAAALPNDDSRNKLFPGKFDYGGGHIIEEFVAGKNIKLVAKAYGTDCYPRKELKNYINIKDVNEAVLFNVRNCYQNYNCAVNPSSKTIYTYMGVLKPNTGNATYCSAGQLSPLLKDPYYRTIGLGTRIFFGGGIGYIAWQGTQHSPAVARQENGTPKSGAGTLAVIGDLKQMMPQWLRGTSMLGYGVTLTVGIGIPIPIIDEEMAAFTAVKDDAIFTQIIDYSHNYPQVIPGNLGTVSYAQLKSGEIELNGKKIPTASLSSYPKAIEIATTLKNWIVAGKFYLTEPVAKLPGADSGITSKLLKEMPIE